VRAAVSWGWLGSAATCSGRTLRRTGFS
jgi:hypothetical protein